MAQNKQNKMKKKDEKKKGYKNPAKTQWGKVLILVLALAMVVVSIAMLIYYIVVLSKRV